MTDPPLFDVLTVHCFWGWCVHVETGLDPDVVHAAMEEHYETAHRADLDRLLPRLC